MRSHNVMRSSSVINCDRLRLVRFTYFGFDGILHEDGEVVVLDAVATHVAQIFSTLCDRKFPIAKAMPINKYEGNDEASMSDNNTSGFNDRDIAGRNRVSLHALGLAIDLNPVQNPQINRAGDFLRVQPVEGNDYVNRLSIRPGKPMRPGMNESVVDVFAEHGFLIWGGYWDEPIDFQHFEVGRKLAEQLIAARPSDAEVIFERLVQRFRACLSNARTRGEEGQAGCINESYQSETD